MSNRPEMRYNGLTQSLLESAPATPPTTKSAHILLSMILAARGTTTPIFVDANTFTDAFGLETTNNHRHNTHQLKYLTTQLQGQGHAVVKRITLPNAAKAMLRISIELIPARIPLYKLDESWNPVLQYDEDTGAYKRIVVGTRKAYRAVLHSSVGVYPTQYRGFGLGAMSNYRKGNVLGYNAQPLQGAMEVGDTLAQSIVYPIVDLELADYGDFGNAVSATVSPYINPESTYDSAVSELVIRELDTPMVNRDGIAETIFGLTPAGDSEVALARALLLNYSGGFNGLLGRVHTYSDDIKRVTDLLVNGSAGVLGEVDLIDAAIALNPTVILNYPHQRLLDDNASAKYMFNILTGRSNTGVHHINGDYSQSEVYGGIQLAAGELHSFSGGSDGYPYTETGELDRLLLLRMYDEAVRAELESMKVEGHAYHNMSRYPFTVWYDSGYAMDTKIAAFNILKWRPEVTVIQNTFSVADYGKVVAPVIPEISCAGATNTTGTVELDGKFDLYLGKVKILDNATTEQIATYLNATNNFLMEEIVDPVEPPPFTITCAGATLTAEFTFYLAKSGNFPSTEAFEFMNENIVLKVDGAFAQPAEVPPRFTVADVPVQAPELDGYFGGVLRYTALDTLEHRFELFTLNPIPEDINGNPLLLFKPYVGNTNPTLVTDDTFSKIGFCLAGESGISSMTLWIDGEEIVTGNIAALKAVFANNANPNFRETGDVGVFRLINVGTLDHQVKITSPQDLSTVVVDGNGAVEYLNDAIYIYFKGTVVESRT